MEAEKIEVGKGVWEEVIENFSVGIESTTYEATSATQATVTHKIGKVQTLEIIKIFYDE